MSTALVNLPSAAWGQADAPKAIPSAECIVCGKQFVLTRSDKRTCSRKCGIKHQHNKKKEPTLRDLLTGLLVKTVSPEDEHLYSDEATHLLDKAVLTRTGAGADEWTQDFWNEREWPEKLHPTSRGQSKKARIVSAARERGDIPYHAIRDGVRSSVTFDTWESPGFVSLDAFAVSSCPLQPETGATGNISTA